AAKTVSCFNRRIPSENLLSNSVLLIVLAALYIWCNSSSRRRIHFITDLSNISVILQTLRNDAPLHQAKRTSMRYGLNFSTYASSSISNLHSVEILAILLTSSCIERKGPDNSFTHLMVSEDFSS
uniref:Uncharacterized protein n=1 Tax=Glossina brevipalpis TaxID=37001 RepID=A0A1A9VZI1_9MUSC